MSNPLALSPRHDSTSTANPKPTATGDMNSQQPSEIEIAAKIKISRWETDLVNGSTVHGVENEVLALQKMLEKPQGAGNGLRAIGIIGVRGIGKSTVCRALLQSPEVKSKFLPRIWVSMSRDIVNDPKIGLLKSILISLRGYTDFLDGETVGSLLYRLRLQLRGKRYLIVLDDVQDIVTEEGFFHLSSSENVGEKLREGFPNGNGGAVIVTSRSEKAAKAMVGEENLRRLVPQKDPESFWKIFEQEAPNSRDSFTDLPNLTELKVELLNQCGGVPLAAKMMGEKLRRDGEDM